MRPQRILAMTFRLQTLLDWTFVMMLGRRRCFVFVCIVTSVQKRIHVAVRIPSWRPCYRPPGCVVSEQVAPRVASQRIIDAVVERAEALYATVGLDVRRFIGQGGSLFLIADQQQAAEAVPVLTALAEHFLRIQFALEEQFIADHKAELEAFKAAAEQQSD